MSRAAELELLQERLSYRFATPALLVQALTHTTYANEHPSEGPHNERLEFLGDAVVGLVTAQLLFERFTAEPEGELTRRRARVVRREALAELARELGLGELLRMGQGQRLAPGGATLKVLGDAFEALVGALYLDGGQAAVDACITPRLATAIDASSEPTDWKTLLQERCHERGRGQPRYGVVRIDGPDHERRYTCEVAVDGEVLGTGAGTSKRAAEQACAKLALTRLTEVV